MPAKKSNDAPFEKLVEVLKEEYDELDALDDYKSQEQDQAMNCVTHRFEVPAGTVVVQDFQNKPGAMIISFPIDGEEYKRFMRRISEHNAAQYMWERFLKNAVALHVY